MYIYMEGYQYKHDIFELVRTYLKKEDINFISLGQVGKLKKENKDLMEIYPNYEEGHVRVIISILGKSYTFCEVVNKFEVYTYKRLFNNTIKRSVYLALYDIYKLNLDWGILTGIRPMKIYNKLLDKGLSYLEIVEILEKEYLLSKNKISLMEKISRIQRPHLESLEDNKYSLYINIPFCPSKCSYCSFPSFTIDKESDLVEQYVDTLIYELKETSKIMKGRKVNSVYIGGGTPTFLKKIDLKKIIVTMKEEFNLREKDIEFTVEAGRPDTLDEEKLEMLKDLGVNRISINPQTMNLKTLKKVGRNHDVESIIKAYNLAKSIGFDIINMDLILGLPGENIWDVKNTLDIISKLDPDNLTIHSLAIKSGSELSFVNNKTNIAKDQDPKKLKEIIDYYIKLNNLYPYYLYRQKRSFGNLENIGYSKESKESFYNIVMMEERQTVVGVGLGAVSKIYNSQNGSIKRLANFKGLNDYISRIDEQLYSKKYKIN